jgi:hypothetical protein
MMIAKSLPALLQAADAAMSERKALPSVVSRGSQGNKPAGSI